MVLMQPILTTVLPTIMVLTIMRQHHMTMPQTDVYCSSNGVVKLHHTTIITRLPMVEAAVLVHMRTVARRWLGGHSNRRTRFLILSVAAQLMETINKGS